MEIIDLDYTKNIQMINKLFEKFNKINGNCDYMELVLWYEKSLEQYIHDENLHKNCDFISFILVFFDIMNRYFRLDSDFELEKLDGFMEEMNDKIITARKNDDFNTINKSYDLALKCFPLLNGQDKLLNDEIKFLLIKNSYIINKTLSEDKEKTNLLS